jgi:hypothetical protein
MKMVTDEDIAQAIEAEKAAHEAFIELRDYRERLQVEQASQRYSVSVGDSVKDRKGRYGIVTRIKPWLSGKPWISAKQIKRDGSPGERELNMYSDWEVVRQR